MRIPRQLEPLFDMGVIDEVFRPLMSGKEAAAWIVRADGEVRCAKVYKEANNRSFKQRVDYTEGRRVRNSREARAVAKGSKFGREMEEASWQSTEVDALHKLATAGVRVPRPHLFVEGVLIMELILDGNGDPAPRLCDVPLTRAEAKAMHLHLMQQCVKMLCAGIVHGDLSEYNVLQAWDGPVIIDLPQAVNAAANNSARRIFMRDIDHLTTYLARFAPEIADTTFGREIWRLYEAGRLHPDSELSGRAVEAPQAAVDARRLIREIQIADSEEPRREAPRRRKRGASGTPQGGAGASSGRNPLDHGGRGGGYGGAPRGGDGQGERAAERGAERGAGGGERSGGGGRGPGDSRGPGGGRGGFGGGRGPGGGGGRGPGGGGFGGGGGGGGYGGGRGGGGGRGRGGGDR